MMEKQTHCVAIWITPSAPAKQPKPEMARQQARSARLAGSASTLASAKVADVVPRSTK